MMDVINAVATANLIAVVSSGHRDFSMRRGNIGRVDRADPNDRAHRQNKSGTDSGP